MSFVTFQILSGFEQGRTFRLPTPISIGREEENSLRLNDERVSRFHAKVQEENGSVILTDLDSTNGTRVNGLPVQMRVLRAGDQILLGKSLLLFGSPEELAAQLSASADDSVLDKPTRRLAPGEPHPAEEGSGRPDPYFPQGAPPLPEGLKAIQTAQISDLLTYLHGQLLQAIEHSQEQPPSGEAPLPRKMELPWNNWQQLIQLDLTLAQYLRRLAEPGG